MFKDKKVLVTGGSGMIGRSLVKQLIERGAIVHIVDMFEPDDLPFNVRFTRSDLRHFSTCLEITEGVDFIFHLAGVKGSPKMCMEQPVDFMVPMLQFNTNMMEAAYRSGVEWFLFTSSVGVYSPAEVFYEDSVWSTFPSNNDKFAGWAKRMGELQAEAYKIQYGWDRVSIVRPANVYGPYDNFNPLNAMVIPSLITKSDENDVLEVFGDGTPIRDFIYCDDVARGMIFAVENKITEPINLGSGVGYTIKEVVQIVIENSDRNNEIKWNNSVPSGDIKRLFSMDRSKSYGFEPKTSLREGIKKTYDWYRSNKALLKNKYNPFINH